MALCPLPYKGRLSTMFKGYQLLILEAGKSGKKIYWSTRSTFENKTPPYQEGVLEVLSKPVDFRRFWL
jgi:hypothetical protein